MVCPMPDFETVEFLRREDVGPTPNPYLSQHLLAWMVLLVEFTAARRCRHPAKYSVNKVEIPSREIVLLILFTYSLTHSLTHLRTYSPRSRVLLEKLIISQQVKKFPAFYGTQRFITAFTSARVRNFPCFLVPPNVCMRSVLGSSDRSMKRGYYVVAFKVMSVGFVGRVSREDKTVGLQCAYIGNKRYIVKSGRKSEIGKCLKHGRQRGH
jgi:hypothetical protein